MVLMWGLREWSKILGATASTLTVQTFSNKRNALRLSNVSNLQKKCIPPWIPSKRILRVRNLKRMPSTFFFFSKKRQSQGGRECAGRGALQTRRLHEDAGVRVARRQGKRFWKGLMQHPIRKSDVYLHGTRFVERWSESSNRNKL